MDAARDLKTWPNSDFSSLIRQRPHEWHVQQMGTGPTILLLHGAGGSTHSFADLMRLLAVRFHVVAVDLPGHGFTRLGTRHRSALDTMAQDLESLCNAQGWHPICVIGHSAGAAVALRLSTLLDPMPSFIGLNPALQPFRGLAGVTFPIFARLIALAPFMVDKVVTNMATPARVSTLLAGTGSDIDARGLALYTRLFQDPAHVDGVLLMMAQWKLDGLLADLPHIQTRSLFLTGSQDKTVPPIIAVEAAGQMPDAHVDSIDGLGHLMHEEAPKKIAAHILEWLQ